MRLFILLILFVFLGCTQEPPHALHNQSVQSTVIFIPGFKGSKLVDNEGSMVWVSPWEILFGGSSMALTNDSIGIFNKEFHTAGVLDGLNILPYIYTYNIYGGFLDELKQKLPTNTELISFAYDWRQDLTVTASKLGELVEERKHRGSAITLIGHSMGGMIASYYLRYGKQDLDKAVEDWGGANFVDKVILAGVPFLGSLEIFDDMLIGGSTGPNRSLLTSEAYCSFPSSYQLLPAPSIESFYPKSVDLFDVSTWDASKWGLLNASTASADIKAARLEFTSNYLLRSKKLFALTSEPSKMISPDIPILNIYGKGRETKTQFYLDPSTNKLDFDKAKVEDGDRIVSIKSSSLPESLKLMHAYNVAVESEHGELLSDKISMNHIIKFLQ